MTSLFNIGDRVCLKSGIPGRVILGSKSESSFIVKVILVNPNLKGDYCVGVSSKGIQEARPGTIKDMTADECSWKVFATDKETLPQEKLAFFWERELELIEVNTLNKAIRLIREEIGL